MGSNFTYHPEEDVFYISRNDSNGQVFGSLPIGNFVFDVDNSGKIVGLEIDNASEIFEMDSKRILDAKSANLGTTIQKTANGLVLMIHFSINLGEKNYTFSYAIPRRKLKLLN